MENQEEVGILHSSLAAAIACLIAKGIAIAMHVEGSPVTEDKCKELDFETISKNETVMNIFR